MADVFGRNNIGRPLKLFYTLERSTLLKLSATASIPHSDNVKESFKQFLVPDADPHLR